MKKIATALAVAVLAAVCLTGCTAYSLFEKEYTDVSQHTDSSSTGSSDRREFSEASNYDELKEAYLDMIRDYVEDGVIRLVDYEGDPTYEAADASVEVANGTALGIFAVYNMNVSVIYGADSTIVEVTIDYNKSIRQIKNLGEANTEEEVEAIIYKSVQDSASYVAFSTSLDTITPEYVKNLVERYYYSDASLSVFEPVSNTAVYTGLDDERIIEISYARQYTVNRLATMRYEMIYEGNKYLNGDEEDVTTAEWLLSLCERLAEETEYVSSASIANNRTAIENTAYGAIVNGRASSEGIAMAYKLVCDLNNVECIVVIGLKDNAEHYWNIVNLDGDYYHIDVSAVNAEGISVTFLRSDSGLPAGYEWDRNGYPECRGALSYYDVASDA